MPIDTIVTPPGRLVQGSFYKPSTTDNKGQPLVVKNGPNKGQPRVNYFVAVAIPKVAGQHWASTEWGAKLWAAGHQVRANAGQMGDNFSWKVTDGDSTVLNTAKTPTRPCDQEGFPGNWIVKFSNGFPPKLATLIGVSEATLFDQKDGINLGDFVQIQGSVDNNGSDQTPGLYLNLQMACLVAYGPRIVIGPDIASAGFGGQPLPTGASLTPVGGFAPPPAPLPPGGSAPTPPAPVATAPAPLVPATVLPNPAILAVPTPPPAPGAVAAPPAARVMLPAAGGHSYQSYRDGGWSDLQLIQAGYMAA